MQITLLDCASDAPINGALNNYTVTTALLCQVLAHSLCKCVNFNPVQYSTVRSFYAIAQLYVFLSF